MKRGKTILIILGPLLFLASLVDYVGQVTSCYPSPNIWKKFSIQDQTAFQKACHLLASPTSRFDSFLWLFVTGTLLFTIVILRSQSKAKDQRSVGLDVFLVMLMMDGLLMTLYGLLSYPVPWETSAAPVWVMELIAALGFLIYIACLGIWYWRRWGFYLLLLSTIFMAALILLKGLGFILAAIPILGVIVLVLFLVPVRHNLV